MQLIRLGNARLASRQPFSDLGRESTVDDVVEGMLDQHVDWDAEHLRHPPVGKRCVAVSVEHPDALVR